ncbi:MAG: hypothetical protein FJX71_04880 [Alphaproteobacteria bacterium]|nr:hypothetical protein [Alphaproteobacteria bacterium]
MFRIFYCFYAGLLISFVGISYSADVLPPPGSANKGKGPLAGHKLPGIGTPLRQGPSTPAPAAKPPLPAARALPPKPPHPSFPSPSAQNPEISEAAPNCMKEAAKSPLVLLSIDGAAVRGYAQFKILKALQDRVNLEITKRKQASQKVFLQMPTMIPISQLTIQQMFNYVIGTSAGAANSGGILIPKDPLFANTADHPIMEPKFTLDELQAMLPEILGAAFSRTAFRDLRVLGGLAGSKFTAKNWEELLQKITTSNNRMTRMSDTILPLMILAYDIRSRKPWVFSTMDACEIKKDKEEIVYRQPPDEQGYQWRDDNVFVWQAIRAASAAPVYFKALELELGGKLAALIDAGLYAMSPTLIGWIKIQLLHPGRPMVIISISSGILPEDREYRAKGATAGSIPQVLQPTIETALEGQQAQTDKLMKDLPNIEYFRLGFMVKNKNFDDVSPENIQSLEDAAEDTIKSPEFQKAVVAIANALEKQEQLKDKPHFVCAEKERLRKIKTAPIPPGVLHKIEKAYSERATH